MTKEAMARLVSVCNENRAIIDKILRIMDYTFRTYGTEPRDDEFWERKTSGCEDETLSGMAPVRWTDFRYIMGGMRDGQ